MLISAALSPRGSAAGVLRSWRDGAFELIVSPLLLEELQRAFNYPKLRRRIPVAESHRFIGWIEREATVVSDPNAPPPTRSPDPGDDYLLALAAHERAVLVSQDQHLLSMRDRYPIRPPAEFLERIATDV